MLKHYWNWKVPGALRFSCVCHCCMHKEYPEDNTDGTKWFSLDWDYLRNRPKAKYGQLEMI